MEGWLICSDVVHMTSCSGCMSHKSNEIALRQQMLSSQVEWHDWTSESELNHLSSSSSSSSSQYLHASNYCLSGQLCASTQLHTQMIQNLLLIFLKYMSKCACTLSSLFQKGFKKVLSKKSKRYLSAILFYLTQNFIKHVSSHLKCIFQSFFLIFIIQSYFFRIKILTLGLSPAREHRELLMMIKPAVNSLQFIYNSA